MPRKLLASTRETDDADAGNSAAPSVPSQPEADDVARAEARADAARTRATRLRQQAERAQRAQLEQDGLASEEQERAARRRLRLRLRRPSRRTLVVICAFVLSCATLTLSGFLALQHQHVVEQRQRSTEFADAARNAVVMMTSIDPKMAREDLQRFAEATTGVFKAGVFMGAEDAVKALEESKVSITGAVRAVAVESMTRDSAQVLVAARAEITKPGEPKPRTQLMRLVVTVLRDSGQLKVSRIEFVP